MRATREDMRKLSTLKGAIWAILAGIIAAVAAAVILQLLGPVKMVLPVSSRGPLFQWGLITAVLYGGTMAVKLIVDRQRARKWGRDKAAQQELEREVRSLIDNIEAAVHSRFRHSPVYAYEDYPKLRDWEVRIHLVQEGLQRLDFPQPREGFVNYPRERFVEYIESLLPQLHQGDIEGARRFARTWLTLAVEEM